MNKLKCEKGLTIIGLLVIVIILILAIFGIKALLKNSSKESPFSASGKGTEHIDKNGDIAVIPSDFTIVEGLDIISEGLVIEDKNGNQFVWIPVPDINEMVSISNGKNMGRLYPTNTDRYKTSLGGIQYEDNTPYMEPDGSFYGDNDKKYLEEAGLKSISTKQDLQKQMQAEFDEMKESVEKYKGFYIGRYETSGWNSTVTSKKGKEDIGGENWYTMYAKQKELYNKSSDSIVSGMVWGCQFDQALKFLEKAGVNVKDGKGWGNCKDSIGLAVTGSAILRPTGYSEYWKASNIYDLAGNAYEVTMEGVGTGVRVYRGGHYQMPRSW